MGADLSKMFRAGINGSRAKMVIEGQQISGA